MNQPKKNLSIQKEVEKIQNFFNSNKFETVIDKTKKLLKKDPTQSLFYNLIGLSYRNLNNLKMAEETFLKGLKRNTNSLSILINLGSIYRITDRYNLAKETFERALNISPNNQNALINYANVYRDLNEIEKAINYYNKAFKIKPVNLPLLLNLASSYQVIGKFDEAKKILEQIHENFPNNIEAHKMYSAITNYSNDETHQKIMINKLEKSQLSLIEKSDLNFAIAKSYSDQKNNELSSKYFIAGNELKLKSIENFNFKNIIEEQLFIKNLFKDYSFLNKSSENEPDLIFIVGLPRSGTTLTHQIISSHSKVFGAGELSILKNFFSEKIKDADFINKFIKNDEESNDFKKEILFNLLSVFKQYNKNLIIVDKAPLNFMWIGFIKLLFPNAKIIHCKRNLKDTALSIYKNNFAANELPWAYSQKYLVEFIHLYKDLMKFWYEKIPNFIYTCEYEKLVSNPLEETKSLIKFCNLNWEEACLDHTKNRTAIKTMSIAQARNSIYKSSVNLSKNYSQYLDFLNKINE